MLVSKPRWLSLFCEASRAVAPAIAAGPVVRAAATAPNDVFATRGTASEADAAAIYADVRTLFDSAGVVEEPPFWVAGSGDFDIDKHPTEVGHTFADVWQGLLDVVRTHNGIKLPIDISVSSLASPSAAE